MTKFENKIEKLEKHFADFLHDAKPGDNLDWLAFTEILGFKLNKACLFDEELKKGTYDKLWASHPLSLGLMSKGYPQELAAYLKWIFDHSDEIYSYFEIGPENGGTFLSVVTLLKTVHGADNITCGSLDIKDAQQPMSYDAMGHGYYTKHVMDSRDWKFLENEWWDLIYIDAGHTYELVKNDYEMSVEHCRYLGFHDINLQSYRGGVPRLWNEIKDNHIVVAEFHNEDPALSKMTVGAGILKIKE